MKLTRNPPPVPPQMPAIDSGETLSELTAHTTQRVAVSAPANVAMRDEATFVNEQNAGSGSLLQGHLRRKAHQWLGKLGKRSVPAPGHLPLASQVASNVGRPVRAVAFVLPEAKGPTLLTQTVASALDCAARLRSGSQEEGPSRYIDAKLVTQLLHRDSPKTETFEQLSAAPVERALDSILADEAIGNMPAHLISPIAELGRASADLLDQAGSERRLAWSRALCDALKQEYPRPWSVKTPITTLLCVGMDSDASKTDAVVAFLRKPPSGGFEAMAAMAILRAMYLGAERKGFAAQTVPFISKANRYYIDNMLELTGRIYVKWGAEKPKHQGVGLTAYGAPSPVDASWMQPGTISSHLYQPSPNCNMVVRDLAFGNPYGVGISGSTNIFLFAAGYFNVLGATHINLMAMASAMAIMLCYNGGHSFNEVYAAAQMYPDAASTSLAGLVAYHPGHARGLFIDQVDPQNSWLAEASFGRLAAFLTNPDHTV